MAANQDDITNLNKLIDEIMCESVEAVAEVQLEPQPGEEINIEQGTQPEEDEHIEKEATEDANTSFQKKLKICGTRYCLTRNSCVKGVLGNLFPRFQR